MFPQQAEIPADVRIDFYREADRYLIGGEVRSWSGPRQKVLSPVCVADAGGARPFELGEYPLMTAEAAIEVLDAACRAYGQGCGQWPTMSVADRIRHVESFIPRMQAVREQVVRLLMWEIGKSRADSCKEFDRTVEYIRDTIEALKELDRNSSRFAVEQGFVAQIRRSPLGVVLCMGPQNYPLNETFTTLIPALIMGQHRHLQATQVRRASACPAARSLRRVVPTRRGQHGVRRRPDRGGSADRERANRRAGVHRIGQGRVAAQASAPPDPTDCGVSSVSTPRTRPSSCLTPISIWRSPSAYWGRCRSTDNAAQPIKIIFVHRSLADEFAQRFAAKVGQLKVGMPWDEGVSITPLAEQGRPEWFKSLVDEAVARAGAKVINRGGGTIESDAVLSGRASTPADLKTRICQIEQFGPVTPIVPYDDEREVIDWVVASPFGQQAALFGNDPQRLSRLIDPLANQVSRG